MDSSDSDFATMRKAGTALGCYGRREEVAAEAAYGAVFAGPNSFGQPRTIAAPRAN